MDRMSHTNNYESRLWRLLEAEKLSDLSQFHQRGFFEEVPLIAREADIDFLPQGKDRARQILVRFALKFLKSVIAYEEHRTGFFAAITVWSLSPDPLVPHLFVWCGASRKLEEKLALVGTLTAFGKQVKKLVSTLGLGERFDVLEDIATMSEATRVFIGPARPLYPGFAVLDQFRRPAPASKRHRLRA